MPKPPIWYIILIAIALLPVFSLPAMLSGCQPGDAMQRAYLWMYPFAIAASAYYCWVSYYTRRILAWVMLIFMFLIDASMIYLFLLQ